MGGTLFPLGFAESDENPIDLQNDEEVVFKRSYKFDFKKGDFVTTNTGVVVGTEGTESWRQWCEKAMMTDRYKHRIYSRLYGQEIEDLIPLGLSREANELEIARITEETLMLDPRTASVSDFSFSWAGDECYYSFIVSNIYDETETINSLVVI